MSYTQARALVMHALVAHPPELRREVVKLDAADGRVLASPLISDRDYPELPRTARDGFAVRSADMPGRVRVIGEVRAGGRFAGAVGPGEAVEIMTGAPVPEGADTILMVEHVKRDGDSIVYEQAAPPAQFINARGSESRAGDRLIAAGCRLGYAHIALLAARGVVDVPVYARPHVAIIASGDELVPPSAKPAAHQVRNSNAFSLAAQVRRVGAVPDVLGVARDTERETRRMIELGLQADLLLISGGVSAGKYDVVEAALEACGGEKLFDRVAIQPGQPLVFGRARDRFVFGLPGNPASTMVTFELFARSVLEALCGVPAYEPPFLFAKLAATVRHRTGLTRFLPARVDANGQLTPVKWSGSSDIPAVARANAFMMIAPDRAEFPAGEWMPVMMQ